MFRKLMPILALLFFALSAKAQLIWTDPVFPTANDAVTIYFDATEGTGGLAGCNCNVYVHTGVITSLSTGLSDWKHVPTSWGVANPDWQMTPVAGQPDVYSYYIQPSIEEYYNVTNPNEIIEQMAFVFRNGDGTLEGKDVGGSDIYYEVYPENLAFTATFTSPSSASVFTSVGAVLDVGAEASQSATLQLYDNGTLLTTVTGTSLQYALSVTTGGTHLVELVANNGTEETTISFTYVVPLPNVVEAQPAGTGPGINYLSDTEVLFSLRAPGKSNVFLIGDFNDWQFDTDYQLNKTPDGNFWWIEIGGLTAGQRYAFQYVVDGEIRIADPYSDLILDPGNDGWIPDATFPDMHPYPVNKTTGIVTVIQPGAPEYPWQVTNFQRPEQGNLVIYELLLRDFLHRHDYQTLLDTLNYLDQLGVTAIELMPVNEFDNNESWGYNPTFHHALDKYYGTPDAFRAFIDECHARGIAVILDVVFNHTHEENPLAALYWDAANFRPAANNPWLNVEAPHDYNVFFDFNHESLATKEYVRKVLKHWLDDYHVDGFRFDLSKGLTQNTNGPFHAGNYDATRIATIKDYADNIWAASPGAYVILEHFTANTEEEELSNYGCMLWSGFDVHHQYLEASLGYTSNFSGVSYKSKGWDDPHLISYMESHDEERMMFKNLQYGNSSGDYKVKELETALDRVELASAFFYTVPGPKMLWQFGELGYPYSINHCPNGTIDPNCRVSNKPIRWDYMWNPERMNIFNVVRSLTHLRNTYEVFQTTDFQLNVSQPMKHIKLNSADMNVHVLGNFGVTAGDLTPSFQHTGWWYEYFSGDSLEVTNATTPIALQAGEFRLYTDEKIDAPDAYTGTEEIPSPLVEWGVSPNPAASEATVRFTLERSAAVQLAVFDLAGRRVEVLTQGRLGSGTFEVALPGDLMAGVYIVRLAVDGKVESRQWVNGKW